MTDIIEAWRCVGCGRLEASQPCVGICQDRRVRLVAAEDYEAAAERARVAGDAMALARKLATAHPRGERWRENFLAFQREARAILAEVAEIEGAVAARG